MKTLTQRFRIKKFTNHAGSTAWRVEGYKRDGTRIRENFADMVEANKRHIDLETEYHQNDVVMRPTCLTREQLRDAERAFAKLPEGADIIDVVTWWVKHGKHHAVSESPKVDDALTKFKGWLDGEGDGSGNGHCTLREHSRPLLGRRVEAFINSVGNLRVDEVTPEVVETFLDAIRSRKLNPVSAITCDNYRRDISRFFTFCIERPRRWTTVNPCKEVRVAKGEKQPPEILTLEQCKELLKAAEPKNLAAYTAVCLFGGLRPFEASRLTWDSVNLADREIRLEGTQTKTGRPRVVSICDTLHAWLKKYKDQEFYPSGWHKRFRKVKADAKITEWPQDLMRHTAISHYFRKTGSYGQTAEQFGNSEAIIKNHYQGRVSSDDTEKFYALKPTTKAVKKRTKTKA
jgi:integrase